MARSEISDNEVALYEVLHHPAEFIEFMTPVDERATRRLPLQTWFDEDHFGSVRPYQLPGLPWDHMLPDDKYPIDASKAPGYRGVDRVGVGNGLIFGGRKTSKSFELEHDPLQAAVIRGSERSMITSRDAMHLEERWSTIWEYATRHPLLKPLVTGRRRGDPFGEVRWHNGHVTLAVIESAHTKGDTYLGKHVHRVGFDEYQLTTAEALLKFYDATAEEGCVFRATGVSDGRRGTPASKDRNDPAKQDQVHIRPQFVSDRWTPPAKEAAIENYGGEASHEYETNVKAGEGEPTTGVWDMGNIQACMEVVAEDVNKTLDNRHYVKCPVTVITNQNLEAGFDIKQMDLPAEHGESKEIWISGDIGKRQDPTVLGIHGMNDASDDKIPSLIGMVVLRLIPYPIQGDIIKFIATRYGATQVGIDATGGGGEAVNERLIVVMKGTGVTIHPIDFRHTVNRPMLNTDDTDGRRKKRKNITRTVQIKHFSTQRLFERFRKRRIVLLDELKMRTEFSSEVAKTSSNPVVGETYSSSDGGHRVAMFRVLEMMIYYVDALKGKKRRSRPSHRVMAAAIGRLCLCLIRMIGF